MDIYLEKAEDVFEKMDDTVYALTSNEGEVIFVVEAVYGNDGDIKSYTATNAMGYGTWHRKSLNETIEAIEEAYDDTVIDVRKGSDGYDQPFFNEKNKKPTTKAEPHPQNGFVTITAQLQPEVDRALKQKDICLKGIEIGDPKYFKLNEYVYEVREGAKIGLEDVSALTGAGEALKETLHALSLKNKEEKEPTVKKEENKSPSLVKSHKIKR